MPELELSTGSAEKSYGSSVFGREQLGLVLQGARPTWGLHQVSHP